MSDRFISSGLVKKLGHPIAEIRERSLLRLLSKFKYGYNFDNELSRSKELLFYLLRWFQYDNPTYQDKVLLIILDLLSTSCGKILIDYLGIQALRSHLHLIKSKLSIEHMDLYNKVIELINKLHASTASELDIPFLNIPSDSISTNMNRMNIEDTENELDSKQSDLSNPESVKTNRDIKIYLMPWCQLNDSDLQKISYNNDSLQNLESRERAIYFFKNILINDFPPEVFLNRPTTIKTLQKLIYTNHSYYALEALMSYCSALSKRIKQLQDSSLKTGIRSRPSLANIQSSDGGISVNINEGAEIMENSMSVIKQIPLPIFCLDTIYLLVNMINHNIAQDAAIELSTLTRDITLGLTLANKLIEILDVVVKKSLWQAQNPNKSTLDVIQKVVSLFRTSGDALNKLRMCCVINENKLPIHRINFIRFLSFSIELTRWCDYPSIIPQIFISSLYRSLSDGSLALSYPELNTALTTLLQPDKFDCLTLEDQNNYKNYLEVKNIVESMNSAVKLLQKYDSLKESPIIIAVVKESLNLMEYHKNVDSIRCIVNLLSVQMLRWNLSTDQSMDIQNITLRLLAHGSRWIQETFYVEIRSLVVNILGGLIKKNLDYCRDNELSLRFLLDSMVLMEICSYGLSSDLNTINTCARDIIGHLIRGKLLMSENTWNLLLEALLPSLPLLHVHAFHDDSFGESIIKSLDLRIGEYMLIPQIELIKGNIRLLYSKSYNVRIDGSKNLIQLLKSNEDTENMLPEMQNLTPDLLCSVAQSGNTKNFNISKPNEHFYEEGALLQIINLLRIKSAVNDDSGMVYDKAVDPTFCRSALSQLAVILQQTNLHSLFIKNSGCELIAEYLKKSLICNDFTTFPESAVSCVMILNSLCSSNSAMRQWASEQSNILLNIIRAMLHLPNDPNFISSASQLLCLLVFSHFTINSLYSPDFPDESMISVHYCISNRTELPFKHKTFAKQSIYTKDNNSEHVMKDPVLSNFIRIHWCCSWYGGLHSVDKWPYVPENQKLEFDGKLMINEDDLKLIKITSPVQGCISSLYAVQNATSHKCVENAINILTAYVLLIGESHEINLDFDSLPLIATFRRYLTTPPASPNDSSLLLNVIKFLRILIAMLKNSEQASALSWIVTAVFEPQNGTLKVLKLPDDDVDLLEYRLKEQMCLLISDVKNLSGSTNSTITSDGSISNSNQVVEHLSDSLLRLQIKNINCLAYTNQIVSCLLDLTAMKFERTSDEISLECYAYLIKYLIKLCDSLYLKKNTIEYKGCSLLFNSMLLLCHLLDVFIVDEQIMKTYIEIWIGDCDKSVLWICLKLHNCHHIDLRIVMLKLLSGLMTSETVLTYIETRTRFSLMDIGKMGIEKLTDLTEASIVREQAAILLCNLLATKKIIASKVPKYLEGTDFPFSLFETISFDKLVVTLTKICTDDQIELDEHNNIPLNYISNKENYEVAYSKQQITRISVKLSTGNHPVCSVRLVTMISDVIYNILLYCEKIPDEMIETEIYKMLFRCIILDVPIIGNRVNMCSSICRTLYKAISISDELRDVLIDTKDCLNGLINLFVLDYDSVDLIKLWKYSFMLVGVLITTSHGFRCIWTLLTEIGLQSFFQCVLMSISLKKYSAVMPSALYCLVNLMNSYTSYDRHPTDANLESFFDEITPMAPLDQNNVRSNMSTYGPLLCSHLLQAYRVYNKNVSGKHTTDSSCDSVASVLCNLFAISYKAKMFAIENKFISETIDNLTEIHYSLLTETNQLSIVRNKKKNPVIHRFNWSVLMLCNMMSNCDAAKEICVDSNLAVLINKLWPWILNDYMLRFHTMHMICCYTNSNPKANQTMCVTVGTRSLLMEILDLTQKEMNSVTRKHSLTILNSCLEILQNACSHVHCRTIIVKSDLLTCFNKLHPAITKRQPQWKQIEIMWEQFAETLSRYPEGQLKIGEFMGILCALIQQADGLMLGVLRNCAFHPINRPRYLASAEVTYLFSKILTAESTISDKVCVFVTIWALCANNHKSKLSVKTSGLTAKLTECVQHMKRLNLFEQEVHILELILKIITVN